MTGLTRSTGTEETDASATLWRYFDTGAVDTSLTGSDGTGVARFDARKGNIGTGASSLVVTPGGEVFSTGGASDQETGAIDLIVWKLLP